MKVKTLLQGSFAISIGTVIGGLLSYAFSAAMGRLLGPEKFGDLGAISSFIVIITSVSTALSTISMYYTGHLLARGLPIQVKKFHRRLTTATLIASVFLTGITLLLAPTIVKAFSISDSRALYIALFSVITTFALAINKGILQGGQRFWAMTLINIVEVASKLFIAIFLVKAGLSLTGATLALVASSLVSYAATSYLLRDILKTEDLSTGTKEAAFDRKDILGYLWPTAIATILLLILMNIDTVLVKYYFSPDQAGKYIAIGTIAKIIFFITGPISLVMFPLITEQRAKGEKHYYTLGLSIILTIIGSAFVLLIYYVFSKRIITLLYGSSYVGLEGLLPLASIFVIFTSLVNLMAQYFMSVRKFFFAYLLAADLIVLGYLVSRYHSSIRLLVTQLVTATALLFLLMIVNYLLMKRARITEAFRAKFNGSS